MELWVERADGAHLRVEDGRVFFDAEWLVVVATVPSAAPVLRIASRHRTSVEAPAQVVPLADCVRATWRVNGRTLETDEKWRLTVIDRGSVVEEEALVAVDRKRAAALVTPGPPSFAFAHGPLEELLAPLGGGLVVRWELAHAVPATVVASLEPEVRFRSPRGIEQVVSASVVPLGPGKSVVTARLEGSLEGGAWLVVLRLGGLPSGGGRLELRGWGPETLSVEESWVTPIDADGDFLEPVFGPAIRTLHAEALLSSPWFELGRQGLEVAFSWHGPAGERRRSVATLEDEGDSVRVRADFGFESGVPAGASRVVLEVAGRVLGTDELTVLGTEHLLRDLEPVHDVFEVVGADPAARTLIAEQSRTVQLWLALAPATLPFVAGLPVRGVLRVIGPAGGVLGSSVFTCAPDFEHELYLIDEPAAVQLPSRTGHYALVAHVGEREVARADFAVVSVRELAARARLTSAELVRIGDDGRAARVGERLRADERNGKLVVAFGLELPGNALPVPVPVRVAVVDERNVEEFSTAAVVRLEGPTLRAYAPPIPLAPVKGRRVHVRLEVNGVPVWTRVVELEPGPPTFDPEGGIVGIVGAAAPAEAAAALDAFFPAARRRRRS